MKANDERRRYLIVFLIIWFGSLFVFEGFTFKFVAAMFLLVAYGAGYRVGWIACMDLMTRVSDTLKGGKK